MNDQTKRFVMIGGGIVAVVGAIVLIVVLVGGPSCKLTLVDDKNKPALFEFDKATTLSASKAKAILSGTFKVEKDEKNGSETKTNTYFLQVETKSLTSNDTNFNIQGPCLKSIEFNYRVGDATKENEKDTKILESAKVTLKIKDVNDGNEVTCSLAGLNGKLGFKKDQSIFQCNKVNKDYECCDLDVAATCKQNTSKGKLHLDALYLGWGDKVEFKKDSSADCLSL